MNWFKNLRTVTKLMLSFGLMAVVMAFIGYQGISAANTLNELNDAMYDRELKGLSAARQVNTIIVQIGRETRSAIISDDKAEMEELSRKVEQYFVDLDTQLNETQKRLVREDTKVELAKVKELLPQYQPHVRAALRLTLEGKNKEAWSETVKGKAISDQIARSAAFVANAKDERAKQAADEGTKIYEHIRLTLITCILVATAVFFSIGYFIARLISKPLVETVEVLNRVSEGDLTARLKVETKDEVGEMAESLNRATEAMRTALTEVRNSADSMAAASQELASASEELASGAQEQASSLEETTSTLEEITSTVKQNADNAKQANQVAAGSRDTAQKGGEVVSDAVSAMGEINEASKNIADIITTIDEIAFQTNLLALNAAVEAARAGEQGRGFAVVATEVRNLAQRSATSAKEIKRLIQDSTRKVENGSALVMKSGETLHEIVESVKRVTDIVAEIAAASREQSVGIEQVNKAMIQMDQVTQGNSSQTEELSSTAQGLATHAQQLQALVERFRVDVDAARRDQAAVRSGAATKHTVVGKNRPAKNEQRTGPAMPPPSKLKSNGSGADVDSGAFIEF